MNGRLIYAAPVVPIFTCLWGIAAISGAYRTLFLTDLIVPTLPLTTCHNPVLSARRAALLNGSGGKEYDLSTRAGVEGFCNEFTRMGMLDRLREHFRKWFWGGSKEELLRAMALCHIASFPCSRKHLTQEQLKNISRCSQYLLENLSEKGRAMMLASPEVFADGLIVLTFPDLTFRLPVVSFSYKFMTQGGAWALLKKNVGPGNMTLLEKLANPGEKVQCGDTTAAQAALSLLEFATHEEYFIEQPDLVARAFLRQVDALDLADAAAAVRGALTVILSVGDAEKQRNVFEQLIDGLSSEQAKRSAIPAHQTFGMFSAFMQAEASRIAAKKLVLAEGGLWAATKFTEEKNIWGAGVSYKLAGLAFEEADEPAQAAMAYESAVVAFGSINNYKNRAVSLELMANALEQACETLQATKAWKTAKQAWNVVQDGERARRAEIRYLKLTRKSGSLSF